MKLLKTIATAAFISTSLFAAAPSEAFWGTGEGEPTYDNLLSKFYVFNYKTQKKVYDSPGWLLMTVNANSGRVQKMKLVDCRSNKCIYFKRIADSKSKNVSVAQLNCSTNEYRTRPIAMTDSDWMSWSKILSEEHRVAFNKFCR